MVRYPTPEGREQGEKVAVLQRHRAARLIGIHQDDAAPQARHAARPDVALPGSRRAFFWCLRSRAAPILNWVDRFVGYFRIG